MTKREETKAVKKALQAAGMNVRVEHGKGTSAWWLYIFLVDMSRRGESINIAQRITGRHGDYDGKINVFARLL